jgi:DNA-3-methyladenine glycosylase I
MATDGPQTDDTMKARCAWALGDPLLIAYHDDEWGRPLHDDRALFELLTLEGAQAGLSWLTILRKRDAYRRAFHNFEIERVARYTAADVERLLGDAGIVRNRLKVESAITNARAALELQREFGSLDAGLWQFTGGRTIVNRPRSGADLPATSPESDAMSKALMRHGFKFVGSTICYAFMQSSGMVDDHIRSCWRYRAAD